MGVITLAIIILAVGLIAKTFITGTAGFSVQSPSQLVTLALNAGFPGTDANIAAAIALAESGGDPSALGDYTLDGEIVSSNTSGAVPTSIGLWQIHYTAHPEFDATKLTDATYNASAAYSVYANRGGSFQDWTTYNTGAYMKFITDDGEVTA
jgi:Lysozyme like domain